MTFSVVFTSCKNEKISESVDDDTMKEVAEDIKVAKETGANAVSDAKIVANKAFEAAKMNLKSALKVAMKKLEEVLEDAKKLKKLLKLL